MPSHRRIRLLLQSPPEAGRRRVAGGKESGPRRGDRDELDRLFGWTGSRSRGSSAWHGLTDW